MDAKKRAAFGRTPDLACIRCLRATPDNVERQQVSLSRVTPVENAYRVLKQAAICLACLKVIYVLL